MRITIGVMMRLIYLLLKLSHHIKRKKQRDEPAENHSLQDGSGAPDDHGGQDCFREGFITPQEADRRGSIPTTVSS